MINCIAIDDEPMALEVIKILCKNVSFINLTHTFTQVSAAEKHLRKFPVDLVFLDIQMPDKNGIVLAKSIPQDVMIIFTTAFSQYAVEGFNVDAVDYLLKPIEFERFEEACNKANGYKEYLNSSNSQRNEFLYVRSEYALVKIKMTDIIYLETMDDHIKIHRTSGEVVITLMSMKAILEKLPESEFKRVHRSYTVALAKIQLIRGKVVSISGRELPIGSSYLKAFKESYLS